MKRPYQRIEIGGHVLQPRGLDRSTDYEVVFPDGAHGRRILDMGCNYGYWSLRATHEGATWATGFDNSAASIARANEFAQALGLPAHFECRGIEDEWPDEWGSFDMILCIYVLHHLKTAERITAALGRLAARSDWYDLWLGLVIPTNPDDHIGPSYYKGHPGVHERFLRMLWPQWEITARPAPCSPEKRILAHVRR